MTHEDQRREIAQASRILYAKGVVDAFGHVSCRMTGHADRFLMSRSMAPGLVTPEDVIEHDLCGEPVSLHGAQVFLERFIHAEIYRARQDVFAIVHSHSPSVVPFTLIDIPLQPVAHVCGFLGSLGRPFELADHAGEGSDLMIRSSGLGRALATHLGGSSVALMRGHGFTAVGNSVAEAVFRAVYTAVNCQILTTALQLGAPRALTPAEAEACEVATRTQTSRAWNLWISEHGGF